MKTLFIFFCACVLSVQVASSSVCFIAKEDGGQIIQVEGPVDERYAPCSTFKIPLSLIGFDCGILIDETQPVWPFQEGYDGWREVWRQDQTPKSWIKESCVWYSQVLTTQLGMEKFQSYVTQFDYGNNDLSGDQGQNNGLTQAWLSSSLEISSIEQIAFLEKMLNSQLPIKPYAIAMTKNILFVEDLSDGWKLYGKTGMGHVLNADGTHTADLYHGWFIGWLEKDDRRIIFSNHVIDDRVEEVPASLRAKANARDRLKAIVLLR